MSRRRLATVAVAALATASIALPAFAHASFDKAQVPADVEIDLTFRAPQERASTNARIEALAPRQFTILECTAPTNWTCEVDTTSEAPATVIRWVAGGQAVLPEMDFAMMVRTPAEDQQGVYAWPVIQTYADGFEAEWIGDAAPRVQVGDKDAEVVDNPDPESNHSEPTPAEPSSLPVSDGTPDAGSDGNATATTGADADGDDADAATTSEVEDEGGGAPLGLAIGILAVLGLAGGAIAIRNRAAA